MYVIKKKEKHTLLLGADLTLLQGQHQREESSKERSVSPPSVSKNTDATEVDQDKESGVGTVSKSSHLHLKFTCHQYAKKNVFILH